MRHCTVRSRALVVLLLGFAVDSMRLCESVHLECVNITDVRRNEIQMDFLLPNEKTASAVVLLPRTVPVPVLYRTVVCV